MDSLTQAALGASVGFFCWHKELGRKAIVAGAVLGTLPDLDIIVYPLLDSVQRLYWHRGESHSILFVILAGLLTGWVMHQLVRRSRLPLRTACTGAFLIYGTHILIDFYTVYGTQLLAPFSRHGFAMGNMFIIDPLFSLLLTCGVAAGLMPSFRKAHVINTAALVCAGLYSLWSIGVQSYAEKKFEMAAQQYNLQVIRHFTAASPFTTFLWRHVAETPDGFHIAYWSLFDDRDKEMHFYHIDQDREAVESIRHSRAFAAVEWFSKGWWFAVRENERRVKVVDIRFNEIPSAENHSHLLWNWPFAWSFSAHPQSMDELKAIAPANITPSVTLRLLAKRISGNGGWFSENGNRDATGKLARNTPHPHQ